MLIFSLFFWKHFLIKNFRRKKGNTTNVKNKTIESKNKKTNIEFWFLVSQKTKNQKTQKKTDPTGQTQNQKPKKQKNQTQQGKPKTKIWVLVFGFLKNQKPKNQKNLIFWVFWFLVFGLVPGVCIFLLVGFWFFAGGWPHI